MRFLLSISALTLLFCSCDKNKEMVRYTELYHIEGNDTISAIYIPNSFTPDGDGRNDYFNPIEAEGITTEGYELTIYNSNGAIIFQTNQLEPYWDGIYKTTMAENGVYDYKIKAKDVTGYLFEYSGKVIQLK